MIAVRALYSEDLISTALTLFSPCHVYRQETRLIHFEDLVSI